MKDSSGWWGYRRRARPRRRRGWRPEGVLQAFGQGREVLAAENDMRMLETGVGEPEVIEPVTQRAAGDRDTPIRHNDQVGRAGPPGSERTNGAWGETWPDG